MKKVVSALFLTVGIVMVSGGMQTANAHRGFCQDNVVKKGCSGRTVSSRSCLDVLDLETIALECNQIAAQPVPKPIVGPIVAPVSRTVHFFLLGETNINTTNGTFANLTKPGQGLMLKYSKKGSSGQEKSIILTTDQYPTYDHKSPDSKYPVWRATDSLPDGDYTGMVYHNDFETATSSLGGAILTQIFKVSSTQTAVMMVP